MSQGGHLFVLFVGSQGGMRSACTAGTDAARVRLVFEEFSIVQIDMIQK